MLSYHIHVDCFSSQIVYAPTHKTESNGNCNCKIKKLS